MTTFCWTNKTLVREYYQSLLILQKRTQSVATPLRHSFQCQLFAFGLYDSVEFSICTCLCSCVSLSLGRRVQKLLPSIRPPLVQGVKLAEGTVKFLSVSTDCFQMKATLFEVRCFHYRKSESMAQRNISLFSLLPMINQLVNELSWLTANNNMWPNIHMFTWADGNNIFGNNFTQFKASHVNLLYPVVGFLNITAIGNNLTMTVMFWWICYRTEPCYLGRLRQNGRKFWKAPTRAHLALCWLQDD